jgi:hypothetical protein
MSRGNRTLRLKPDTCSLNPFPRRGSSIVTLQPPGHPLWLATTFFWEAPERIPCVVTQLGLKV